MHPNEVFDEGYEGWYRRSTAPRLHSRFESSGRCASRANISLCCKRDAPEREARMPTSSASGVRCSSCIVTERLTKLDR